jgi:hypothetical protein
MDYLTAVSLARDQTHSASSRKEEGNDEYYICYPKRPGRV